MLSWFWGQTSVSKTRTSAPKRSNPTKFLVSFVLVLLALALAARPLAKGAMFYESYWGGAVFVPFVLLIGAVLVVIVASNWNRK